MKRVTLLGKHVFMSSGAWGINREGQRHARDKGNSACIHLVFAHLSLCSAAADSTMATIPDAAFQALLKRGKLLTGGHLPCGGE